MLACCAAFSNASRAIAIASRLDSQVVHLPSVAPCRTSSSHSQNRYRYFKMQRHMEDNTKTRIPADPKSYVSLKKAGKLRGQVHDPLDVRISKSLSWVLRHGAESTGITMRSDGYVRVKDILEMAMFRDLTFLKLEEIIRKDQKQRYHLLFEPDPADASNGTSIWWIRANQGHSMKSVALDLQPILSADQIPMAVHGTTRRSWRQIATQGLSRMSRNHIHLAQGVPGDGVISGMRSTSQIFIFIDVQKMLDDGFKFFLSSNGVVLTEGIEDGRIPPAYFSRVENADRTPVSGWEGRSSVFPGPSSAGVVEGGSSTRNTDGDATEIEPRLPDKTSSHGDFEQQQL